MKYTIFVLFFIINFINGIFGECDTLTTVSGPFAPSIFIFFIKYFSIYSENDILESPFCPGDLIFEENFDTFDTDLWQHEVSLYGGYNGEFQWYTNDRANTRSKDGTLFITPTLTYKYLPCNCTESLSSYALDLFKVEPFVWVTFFFNLNSELNN